MKTAFGHRKMKRKNQILLLFAAYFSLISKLCEQAELSRNQNGVSLVDEVHVGVILDMGTREGKTIYSSISMAISDFYSLHSDYEVRIVLHMKDSKGDPLLALFAAFNLLENAKVGVILSAQTSILEANFLAELGDKTKIPVISFSTAFGSSPSLNNYPYFIQIAQDETAEVKGIVSFIELHNWENVILIYEDNDNWSDFFEHTKNHIAYKSGVARSSKDDQIIKELHMLKAMQTTVFVVHVSHVLASRLFLNAKRLGMISQGYAWIVTSKSMNHLQKTDSSIFESMQGVLGCRSYITESEQLQNFTSRMRKEVYNKELDMLERMHINLYGLWAYDVAWSLAKTANSTVLKVPDQTSDPDARLNLMDFDNFRTNIQGWILLQEIFENKFKGLSEEFQFINGKLISRTFEIVNVMGEGERRVWFWTSAGKITKKLHGSRRHLSSIKDLETIIRPGGTSTIPKGRMMQMSGNILRIGVPIKWGFTQLVKVDRELQTNATIATGFCIDVFKAVLARLKYDVQYQFIPFVVGYEQINEAYNDIVYQIERPTPVEQGPQSHCRVGRIFWGKIIKPFVKIHGSLVGVCNVHIEFQLHSHFDINDDGPTD
ncbi:glutamate receptor 1.4-like [Durio zibethinus]|uniref:Glutamate receptor 1.4-like n=1 Tax=Durio zibethinus TaxID=66656 RepID=A0A6P6AXF2_DURZI|nr:glutamate receptor 1.4-like [Durio zibethinus]